MGRHLQRGWRFDILAKQEIFFIFLILKKSSVSNPTQPVTVTWRDRYHKLLTHHRLGQVWSRAFISCVGFGRTFLLCLKRFTESSVSFELDLLSKVILTSFSFFSINSFLAVWSLGGLLCSSFLLGNCHYKSWRFLQESASLWGYGIDFYREIWRWLYSLPSSYGWRANEAERSWYPSKFSSNAVEFPNIQSQFHHHR